MRRVGFLMLLGAVALAPVGIAQQKPADPSKGVPALQGTWAVLTINGQSIADGGMTMTMEITGDRYAQRVNGEVNERGSIKVDASKKPMTIDFTITEGNDAGKPQAGLVEVTGDSMTMHLSQPGDATRPTSMTPQDGFFVVTAKKSK